MRFAWSFIKVLQPVTRQITEAITQVMVMTRVPSAFVLCFSPIDSASGANQLGNISVNNSEAGAHLGQPGYVSLPL